MKIFLLALAVLGSSASANAAPTPGPFPTHASMAPTPPNSQPAELPASSLIPTAGPTVQSTMVPSGDLQPMTPVPSAVPAALPGPSSPASLSGSAQASPVAQTPVPTAVASPQANSGRARHSRAWREAHRRRLEREAAANQ